MASSPVDIVKVYYGTLSLMSAEKAGLYLSSDFTLVGLTDKPLDRATWIAFLIALKTALPDLKVRISKISMKDNTIRVTEIGSGQHRKLMDMSVFDRPGIPASGLQVNFYPSEWVLTIDDNKIARAELISPPSAESGLLGMLKAFSFVQTEVN